MSRASLIEAAIDAIHAIFNDRSLGSTECKETLKDIQGEIDMLIDALEGNSK